MILSVDGGGCMCSHICTVLPIMEHEIVLLAKLSNAHSDSIGFIDLERYV